MPQVSRRQRVQPIQLSLPDARSSVLPVFDSQVPRKLKPWCPCPYSTPKRRHTIVEKDGIFICCSCDQTWTLMGEPLGKRKGVGCFPPDLILNKPLDLRELFDR